MLIEHNIESFLKSQPVIRQKKTSAPLQSLIAGLIKSLKIRLSIAVEEKLVPSFEEYALKIDVLIADIKSKRTSDNYEGRLKEDTEKVKARLHMLQEFGN